MKILECLLTCWQGLLFILFGIPMILLAVGIVVIPIVDWIIKATKHANPN